MPHGISPRGGFAAKLAAEFPTAKVHRRHHNIFPIVIIIVITMILIFTMMMFMLTLVMLLMLMLQEDEVEVASSEFPTLCQRKTYYQVKIITTMLAIVEIMRDFFVIVISNC